MPVHQKKKILLDPYQIGRKKKKEKKNYQNHSILTIYRREHLHVDSDNKINKY